MASDSRIESIEDWPAANEGRVMDYTMKKYKILESKDLDRKAERKM